MNTMDTQLEAKLQTMLQEFASELEKQQVFGVDDLHVITPSGSEYVFTVGAVLHRKEKI
jgi:hypothetical protein